MKRALLVIDVQNEYFTGRLPIVNSERSLGNILKAMVEASKNEIPIILIQHTAIKKDSKTFAKGSKEWEIHDKVKNRRHNYVIEKNMPGSFTGTYLEALLRRLKADTVTVCGYMTQMCCDTTARQAFHLGFSVEFLSDATGTLDISNSAGSIKADELQKAVLITQQMKFSKVLTTDKWINCINNLGKNA